MECKYTKGNIVQVSLIPKMYTWCEPFYKNNIKVFIEVTEAVADNGGHEGYYRGILILENVNTETFKNLYRWDRTLEQWLAYILPLSVNGEKYASRNKEDPYPWSFVENELVLNRITKALPEDIDYDNMLPEAYTASVSDTL